MKWAIYNSLQRNVDDVYKDKYVFLINFFIVNKMEGNRKTLAKKELFFVKYIKREDLGKKVNLRGRKTTKFFVPGSQQGK